ncbi:MAG: glycerol kinase, partial [Clostridia bacterium]|nr:glycerol kinase [Clostridia bacterium]
MDKRTAVLTRDAGTSRMRCVVRAISGEPRFTADRAMAPRGAAEGAQVERDAAVFGDALVGLTREASAFCADAGVRLLCLSLSSQRSSLIALDGGGEPLRPAIMWQDRRTEEI